jgi:hypothetical protein
VADQQERLLLSLDGLRACLAMHAGLIDYVRGAAAEHPLPPSLLARLRDEAAEDEHAPVSFRAVANAACAVLSALVTAVHRLDRRDRRAGRCHLLGVCHRGDRACECHVCRAEAADKAQLKATGKRPQTPSGSPPLLDAAPSLGSRVSSVDSAAPASPAPGLGGRVSSLPTHVEHPERARGANEAIELAQTRTQTPTPPSPTAGASAAGSEAETEADAEDAAVQLIVHRGDVGSADMVSEITAARRERRRRRHRRHTQDGSVTLHPSTLRMTFSGDTGLPPNPFTPTPSMPTPRTPGTCSRFDALQERVAEREWARERVRIKSLQTALRTLVLNYEKACAHRVVGETDGGKKLSMYPSLFMITEHAFIYSVLNVPKLIMELALSIHLVSAAWHK